MAAAELFQMRISGRGGHGAAPHLAIDPLVAAAQIITALQSIVSRNVAPLKSAVISVTAVQGGEAFNVIPSTVEMKGTIRTFEPQVRDLVLERFSQVVTGVAQSMECQAELTVQPVTPAVINDAGVTQRVQAVAERLLPDSQVDADARSMVSEDMAEMMQDIPGCYFLIGSANAEKGLDAVHHHPRFDFDEDSLPSAAALMASAAADLLRI